MQWPFITREDVTRRGYIIACHEAAHAVASLKLLGMHSFSGINLNEDEHQLGAMKPGDYRLIAGKPDASIVISFAGYFGALMAGAGTLLAKSGAGADFEHVAQVLKDTQTSRSALRKRAERFVVRNWKSIEAVGQALLRTGCLFEFQVANIVEPGSFPIVKAKAA